jgi:ferredoxin
MPAHEEEVHEALDEGVEIENGWGPHHINVENGKVVSVAFIKCVSLFDAEGKFSPKYDYNQKKTVPCDTLLLSVGQTFDYGEMFKDESVTFTQRKTIAIDPITLQTSVSDIFAGGDVAKGPGLAIDAIAAGKEGAVSIHRYVQPGQSLVFGRDRHDYKMLEKEALAPIDYDGTERQRINAVDGEVAKTTFKDLRGVLTEEQIALETARCLGCGATKSDEYLCVGCGACTLKCKFDAIRLERVHDAMGYEIDDLPKAVIKNTVIRKAKITLNKINPFSETR